MRNAMIETIQQYSENSTGSALPNIKDCEDNKNSAKCKMEQHLSAIRKLGLPIGWDDSTNELLYPVSSRGWMVKSFGWLITALAVSLGAPFWFDVLNKFMIVRSTVKPKAKSPEEPPVS